jgi:hypothetical protein
VIELPREEQMVKNGMKSPAKRGEDEVYNIKYPFDR